MHRYLNLSKNIISRLLNFSRVFRIFLSLVLDLIVVILVFFSISKLNFFEISLICLITLFLNLYFGIYINNLRRSLLFNNIKLLLSLSINLVILSIFFLLDIFDLQNLSLNNTFSSICISYFIFYIWRTLFLYIYDKSYSQLTNKKKIILFESHGQIEFILKIIQEFEIIAICDLGNKKKFKSRFRAIPYINSDELKNYLNADIYCMVNKIFFYQNDNFQLFENLDNSVIIFEKKPDNYYEILDPDIPFLLSKQFDFKKTNNANLIKKKNILITGAGGSIGGELLRQCLSYKPSKIVILDHDEFSIYNLNNRYIFKEMISIVGSITNKNLLKDIFLKYNFDYVFHCAAYKHVNLVQNNFYSVFYNNIIGTMNLAKFIINNNKTKLIFVSTDKAIKPSSTMGASKRICELYLMSLFKKNNVIDKLRIVRFGNVIGSKGSFIPKLIYQIKNKQTITITHSNVQRYFMTVDQAVGLILSSISLNNSKECIFTFRMGKSINIKKLSEKIVKYSGFYISLNDLKIKFSKLSSGEKLNEILFLNEKRFIKTSNNDIYLEFQNLPTYNKIIKFINASIKNDISNKQLKDNLIRFSREN